ncbi:MAG: tetratricopeptide repeat protein, partial [Candidatus Nanohaloarchaeota archaeon]|nr:tetratricopeptide repeat protein [Candidatus Nanohaloarchaeota archaeon]
SYIGSLEEDEDSSVVFTFIPKEAGTHNIKIEVSYKDDTGHKQIVENYSLNVVKRKKDYAKYVVISLVVVGIVAYFGTKAYTKNKNKR